MKLRDIAEQSLRDNILQLSCGRFLLAGQHQFKTLWTRDFCHSVKGLLAINEGETARSHLAFLLKSLRSDGLVPRALDCYPVQARVLWQSARTIFSSLPEMPFKEPLQPQFNDEHGSHAYDSNILIVLAALEMDDQFWNTYQSEIRFVWDWYEDKFDEGLLTQSPYSDWQDTTKREGRTFLLNLFYYIAGRRLEKKGISPHVNLDEMKNLIDRIFFNGEVYRSLEGSDVVSVEGNLYALEAQEFLSEEEKKALWENLKSHPIIYLDKVIGRCSFPDWPLKDLAFHVRVANLQLYHGSLSWSWIMGLGLKVSYLMQDHNMAQAQLRHLENVIKNEVGEIYNPDRDFSLWSSKLITAEQPFSWGAAYIIEALVKKVDATF
jgi:hypothetical protein